MCHLCGHPAHDHGAYLIPLNPDGTPYVRPEGLEGQSFVLSEIKWGSTTQGTSGGVVTWSFATTNLGVEPDDVSFNSNFPSFFQDEVRAAFDAWAAVANITFVEVADGSDVDIRIGMGSIDGNSGTLGVAYQSFFVNNGSGFNRFAQVHILMDDVDYANTGDQSQFYSTILHEIGHAIGLEHEDDVPSIMSTFLNPNITDLTSDDIQGAQAIYGAADGAEIVDDVSPDSTGTNGSFVVGTPTNGDIEIAGDQDWYAVDLIANHEYQFDLTGVSLSDPLLTIRNANGVTVAQNDDGGPGLDSRITFTPDASGTYYVVAAAFGSNFGTYTLTASDLGSTVVIVPGITITEDGDAAGSTATTAEMISGDTFNGTLSSGSDQDYIRINLTAGVEYTFDVQGAGAGTGTLADPYILVRNANGASVASNNDGGIGDDAQVTFTPTTSGEHFIIVRTFAGTGGTYSVVTSPGERTDDVGGGGSGGGSGGPVIPGILVTEGAEDADDGINTTFHIVSGDTFDGRLDSDADDDWVRIDLTAGVEYTFELLGSSSEFSTVARPELSLYNVLGTRLASDDDINAGASAVIVFTPTVSGAYYLGLDAGGFATTAFGDYRLLTTPGERTDLAEPGTLPGLELDETVSDAAGSAATSYALVPGDSVEGQVSTGSDRDWFAIELVAGRQYFFRVERLGGSNNLDHSLVLRDANGAILEEDNGTGFFSTSEFFFVPSESGTYYLDVSSEDNSSGRYLLTTYPEDRTTLSEPEPEPEPTPEPEPEPEPTPEPEPEPEPIPTPTPDPTTPGTPLAITVVEGVDAASGVSTAYNTLPGDTFVGTLSSAVDSDWIGIDLNAGTQYTFNVAGSTAPGGLPLTSPFIVLYDQNASFISFNTGGAAGAQITFTPSSSGTYYLDIRSLGGLGGGYTVTSTPLERTTDDPLPVGAQSLQQSSGEGYAISADRENILALIDEAQLT